MPIRISELSHELSVISIQESIDLSAITLSIRPSKIGR
jgi:hypothetical protein